MYPIKCSPYPDTILPSQLLLDVMYFRVRISPHFGRKE